MNLDTQRPYNERLFSKGFRSKIHYSRFNWLKSRLKHLNCLPVSVLELGCFDAKTIHFLPSTLMKYVGLDADFEGGFSLAKKMWNNNNYKFLHCTNPDDIKFDEKFDISICMETFEYINNDLLEEYVFKLALYTKKYIFVTTSNQKGIGFAIKHLLKIILGYGVPYYSAKEFYYASIGRMYKIKRNFRKGWDYKIILKILQKHFEIIEVSKYPFKFLPGFGICIIGKSK